MVNVKSKSTYIEKKNFISDKKPRCVCKSMVKNIMLNCTRMKIISKQDMWNHYYLGPYFTQINMLYYILRFNINGVI